MRLLGGHSASELSLKGEYDDDYFAGSDGGFLRDRSFAASES
jgi:hypothetical protein